MEHLSNESGWRGSRELWLEAAYEVLLETGIDAVKILPLAKMLGLSRTSFYWFFEDREQLLSALLEKWKDKNTGNLIRQTEAYAESIAEGMLNVFDCWLDTQIFDAKFEFAVRSWALQSTSILDEVHSADQARIAALAKLFQRFGHDEISAQVRARTVYLVQIGYISMQTEEDVSIRMKRIAKYVEIFSGQAPQQREMDRFFSRHSFSES